MYPLALEQQYGELFREEFAIFASELNRKFLSIAKKYIRENPNTDPRLDTIASQGQNQTEVKHDVSDLLKSLFELRDEYGDFPPRPKFESQIKRNIHQIDAWTRDKTGALIQSQNELMGSPPRAGVSGGDRSQFRVPAVSLPTNESPVIWNRVNETINKNRKIASSAFKSHFADVQSQIEEGIRNGTSYQDIAKKISETTDVSQSRAEFWAKDQAKNFFAEQTKIRQTSAGFPGFYWKTQKDSRVRDTHSDLQDKYFTWDELPFLNRKGLGLVRTKPGDEWGCRCWAEPARGPKENKVNNASQPSIQVQSREPNLSDSLVAKVQVNSKELFVPKVNQSINDLSAIYKVPSSLTPFKVNTMAPKFQKKNVVGYYDPESSVIALNPSSNFGDVIQSTFLHEFGHLIDYQLMGPIGVYGSQSAALASFKTAVVGTKLYDRLKMAYRTGMIMRDGEIIELSKALRDKIPYLLSTEEFFARSHEMYIARKLGSSELLRQIRKKEKMNFVSHYWDDDDFKKVEQVLDKIFNEHGILK
ncbi:phage head morphogenesis protein [Leptospira bouyouniensis]|uniref:Phage head morphogenesis protein n=1 Tax=Leptospira bouyouniensis TaxID=2484911 RepID=A0A7I0HSG8_9LEPT|nr:phage minor head protein [Leptospira bouyouniensis]TGL06488.1 phage head morphogenesis protein [Leptospira bouyouniensis]